MPRFSWNYCIEETETEFVLIPDADQSAREGWAVVNDTTSETRIESIDGLSTLAHDGEAWDLVARMAVAGSEYHVAALEHVRRHNQEGHWDDIEEWIRQGGNDHEGKPRPRWEEVVEAADRYEMTRPSEDNDVEVAQIFRPAA